MNNEIAINVDVKNTSKIKRNTKHIADAINNPIIETIFGKNLNIYCHIRLDLN